jgi:hypothetical protein
VTDPGVTFITNIAMTPDDDYGKLDSKSLFVTSPAGLEHTTFCFQMFYMPSDA